jgi:hypothetical protein
MAVPLVLTIRLAPQRPPTGRRRCTRRAEHSPAWRKAPPSILSFLCAMRLPRTAVLWYSADQWERYDEERGYRGEEPSLHATGVMGAGENRSNY